MPAKSKSQYRMIQALRSKNPNKKLEWYWKAEWIDKVDYDKLPETNLKPYKRLFSEAKTVRGYKSPEPGNLPKAGADLLAEVYASCREKSGNKESCAKQAWGVVKKAGYKK